MSVIANWSYPTSIRFGAGRIVEIADACKTIAIKKPLLVTDKGLAKLDITHKTLNILNKAGLGSSIFSEVDSNPTEINAAAGIKIFQEGKHDGIIAFGGGSGIDLGKLIAFMVGQQRPIWDFEDVGDWWTRADTANIMPIIAIPTTAGTGSEVGRASVITNSQTQEKKIIFHPKILPKIVICDPELTIGMPSSITAGTGMDAFAHCLEAYCSPHYHPMSHGIALEGMKLVKENLPIVFKDRNNMSGRSNMMCAAIMGATAFQKGLGAIHAVSHPIGAVHNTHHGTTNAVVMREALLMNRIMIEPKIEALCNYLEISDGFEGFICFVTNLNKLLNIPNSLTKLGVKKPNIQALVESALNDPSCNGNPIKLTKENMTQLFKNCL
ncbi:MAG: alcohol dehydrogenase [Rhodobacterales bacterium]|nr:alcohol dehydrogenase [Rhodobacterales bacterium]